MALPVLSNARRYLKYGRSARSVEKQLVRVTLFGVPNVWIHRKAVERFQAWESSVRLYESGTVFIGGTPHKRVARPWKPTRIDSWNWRSIRGSKSRSLHSWGVAIDVFPHDYIPPYVTNRAIKRGLSWGGHFRRKDPMHFELRR